MQRQSSDPREGMTFEGGVQWLILALVGYGACFWPFLRCRFGVQMPGIAALGSIAVMWGYVLAVPESAPAMAVFAGCWFVLVLVHRVEALANRRDRHSRSDGYQWLAMCLRPRPADRLAATGYEAAILLLAGTLLAGLSPPLGLFVVFGGVPLVLKAVIDHARHQQRIRGVRDIDLEMQSFAEEYRERYRNRR